MRNPPFSVKRRRFLAGASTLLVLPVLESLLPRQAWAAGLNPPKRLVLAHVTCGLKMNQFTPSQTGSSFVLSPTLSPLSKVQKSVLVLSNMRHDAAYNSMAARPTSLSEAAVGKHGLGLASLFSGAKTALSANNQHPQSAQGAATMDHLYAATQAGTPVPSLQLALPENAADAQDGDDYVYWDAMHKISWPSAASLADEWDDPVALFNKYFAGASSSASTQVLDAQRSLRKSVLDNVLQQANDLQAKLSKNDAQKLDQYFTSVRELEQQLTSLATFDCSTAQAPASSPAADDVARANAMMDIMALAFQCDLTRAISFNFGVGHNNHQYSFLGDINWKVHDASHSANTGQQAKMDAQKARMEQWEISRLARFWEALQAIQEGSGTALDNSVSLVASEIADSNAHDYVNTGVLVVGGAGGAITTGRHVRAGTASANGNLTELQLAIMQALGVPMTTFGAWNTTRAMTLV